MMRNLFLAFFLIIAVANHAVAQGEIWIKPNKGQWHQNIQYLIKIPGGEMFLENNGFTYQFHNGGELMHNHNHGEHDHHEDETFKKHVVKTKFLGANFNPSFKEAIPSTHVENYFLGNDPSKWVSNLTLYNQIDYLELYPGINLSLYQKDQTLKYDIIVNAGADISQYKVKYSGQESIEIIEGTILVRTTLGTITEGKPYAYQMINGLKKEVPCRYILNDNNVLSFDFPKGYDNNLPLIIDPVLLFSTFTGAQSDNWGMTACPDNNDQLIAAGIVFGLNYPTTTGAINTSGNPTSSTASRICDIGLTKFTPNGTGIEFSTFIGGNRSETPHSVVVNDLNQIFLMGATASTDFPVPATGYQSSFQGGVSLPFPGTVEGISFSTGTDIFVLKIHPNGSSILNGTYLGGSGNDGISNPTGSNAGNSIAFNYGDKLRGEIIVDQNSSVYIVSTTKSTDFPILGGFGTSLSGTQDAVIVKLNNTLSNILYSSYVGGSGLESGNSVQISSVGDIFIAGGTTSNNFPNTAGQLNPNFNGGSTDGYVLKLEAPNYTNPIATYIGTGGYDQTYFVQLDLNDNVYLYGQTNGNYPITAGKYNNANSGQFIHKLNNALSVTEWSSLFGAGTGDVEISPTAFLVSDCYEIYVAGWGGNTNNTHGSPNGSTTSGFPLTPDAHQNTTSGSNFWIGVFDPDMVSLKYATFMGNTNHTGNQGDHVDGGTSRFSKGGKIYHAVCAACSGGGFPTTPGAYSTTNGYPTNCNMAAFVFDLSKIEASLGAPLPVTCLPNATVFNNSSINGNTFTWYFGDGDSAVAFSPTHLYPGPGTYDVTLIVSDSNGCYTPDTAYTQVEIILPVYSAYPDEDTICPGTSVQVHATGGTSYIWSPPGLFNNPNFQSPIGTFYTDTTITVEITSACGVTTLDVDINVFDVVTDAIGDTIICTGNPAFLSASGGGTYQWYPGTTLNDSTIASPIAEPPITTFYSVYVTTPDGCQDTNFVLVQVDQGLPNATVKGGGNICLGDAVRLEASGANSYNWSPNYNISSLNAHNPLVWPEVDTTYQIIFTNACGTQIAEAKIYVNEVIPTVRPDTAVCPFEPIVAWAGGGEHYLWTPTLRVDNPKAASTTIRPSKSLRYTVEVSDNIGCSDTISFLAEVFDLPKLEVSEDVYAVQGDLIPIWAEGDGDIEWFPKSFINCSTCKETEVYPPRNDNYTAILTDQNGCKVQDDVAIFYSPLIYVPNAFTPDGNNFNNVFKAVTNNIEEFEMTIYNRWGEIVFKTYDPDGYWDGYYGGKLAQDGLYVWKIHYTDLNEERQLIVGHVSLLK